MLDSFESEAWKAKLIQDLVESPYLDIALVIFNKATKSPQQKPRRSLRQEWPTLLYKLYSRIDRRLHQTENHNAFAIRDIKPVLNAMDLLEVMPIRKKFVDRFTDSDLNKIKEARLDVILRFGFRVIKGDILNCAKCGVWSFHHDDSRYYRGTPPLFWEIYERNPVSGSILQVLNEGLDAGRVLYRSGSSTNFSSQCRNQNGVYWKTAEFVIRRLRQLYSEGWDSITKLETYNEVNVYDKPLYRTPTNLQMLRFFGRQAALYAKMRLQMLRQDEWFLGIQRGQTAGSTRQTLVDIIYPPAKHFYADPFLFSHGGRKFVFFEDYSYTKEKGTIGCLEIEGSGKYSDPVCVLERDYHLSYPFLFEWQSDIFMMPETRSNRTVEVYRAVEFPNKWELHRVLLSNVEAVDPTLLQYHGKFWLFANMAITAGAPLNDELFLFYSDSPIGPWLPHAQNPIVSDVSRARPAGRIIEQGDQLIRPSQDCSLRYGHQVNLNRIEVLTETQYRESLVGKIEPDWTRDSVATHTIATDDCLQVFDGCRTISRIWPRWFSIRRVPTRQSSSFDFSPESWSNALRRGTD